MFRSVLLFSFVVVAVQGDPCKPSIVGQVTQYPVHYQTTLVTGQTVNVNFKPVANCNEVGLYVKACEPSDPAPLVNILDLDNAVIIRHDHDFYNEAVTINGIKYCSHPVSDLHITVVKTS